MSLDDGKAQDSLEGAANVRCDLTPSQLVALGTPAYRFANTPRGSSVADARELVRLGLLIPVEWISDATGALVNGFQRSGRVEAVLAEHSPEGAAT